MPTSNSIQILLCYKIFGTESWSNKNRSAPYWRLYWNANEGASLSLDNKVVELGPKKVVIIPPNTPFDKHARCSVNHFFIHFSVSYSLGTLLPGFYEVEITPQLKNDIHETILLLQKGNSGAPQMFLLSHSIVAQSLFALSEKIQSTSFPDERIATIANYMEAHIAERFSNTDLSGLIGMNTNAFIHFFKTHMKLTPMKYFDKMRLQKACNLLQFSALTIDHIADETGFCDRNHFTKTFIKSHGIGPSEFRKKTLPGM
jgi:AraC-like DNA-binding protein